MKVLSITVRRSMKVDVGYIPYMNLLASLGGRKPEFGIRNNSSVEMSFQSTAELEEGEDVGGAILALSDQLSSLLYDSFERAGIEVTEDNSASFTKADINTLPDSEF